MDWDYGFRRIVTLHEGTIVVTSWNWERIHIESNSPSWQSRYTRQLLDTTRQSEGNQPEPIDSATVLIVDDAPSNRKVVFRLLKSRGFVCHEAERQSMSRDCEVGRPSFWFNSDGLWNFDGSSTARKLRELTFETLIFGFTGNVLPEDKEYFIQQGANLMLTKPLNI